MQCHNIECSPTLLIIAACKMLADKTCKLIAQILQIHFNLHAFRHPAQTLHLPSCIILAYCARQLQGIAREQSYPLHLQGSCKMSTRFEFNTLQTQCKILHIYFIWVYSVAICMVEPYNPRPLTTVLF